MTYQAKLIGEDPMSGFEDAPEWVAYGNTRGEAIRRVFEAMRTDGIEIPEEEIEEVWDDLETAPEGDKYEYRRSEFSDPESNFTITVIKDWNK